MNTNIVVAVIVAVVGFAVVAAGAPIVGVLAVAAAGYVALTPPRRSAGRTCDRW